MLSDDAGGPPGMRTRRWGRIINLSSVAAQVGGVVGPHYAASKAGMLGLTRYYASHLAREGITANAIAPALIETDMVTANPNAKADRIPAGRFGNVDEVASVVVMLARNAYVTGQTIHVNGGWYLTLQEIQSKLLIGVPRRGGGEIHGWVRRFDWLRLAAGL